MAAPTHGSCDTHTSHYHITPITTYNTTCAHGKHLVRIPTSTYSTDYRKHYYNAETTAALTEVDDLESRAVNYTIEPPVLKLLPCESLPTEYLSPNMIPSTPVALPATDITYQSFTANWEPVTNVVSYTLDVTTDPEWGDFEIIEVGDVTSYSVINLIAGVTYYYRVSATNLEYTTGESNVIEATTLTWAGDGALYNFYAVSRKTGIVLYNWYAASHEGGTGVGSIAPIGWHVPTNNDFDTLAAVFGGADTAGRELKEAGTAHWNQSPNNLATNSSGFTAVPAGIWPEMYGYYNGVNYWTVTQFGSEVFHRGSLGSNDARLFSSTIPDKSLGFQLRLIKDNDVDPGTVTDYDGNVYNTVKIGNQVWTTSDLRVEHFNDGVEIPLIYSRQDPNVYSAARYWYLGVSGGLDVPDKTSSGYGWHVPTLADVQALRVAIGGHANGGNLKSSNINYWSSPNLLATNSTGFDAKGTGRRLDTGEFYDLREDMISWTNTVYSEGFGVNWSLSHSSGNLNPSDHSYSGSPVATGEVVRLVKDSSSTFVDGTVGTMTDYEGNTYPTVVIGGKEWMSANLKVATFSDGLYNYSYLSSGSLYTNTPTLIPEVTDNATWAGLTTGAMCWYNNTPN